VLVVIVFCPVLFYFSKAFAEVAGKFSPEQKMLLDTFQLGMNNVT